MVYDWTKNPILPRGDMYAWHQYEAGVSAAGSVNDYSGNGRHYTVSGSPPTLVENQLNGQPGWHFNGSTDPLSWNDSVTFKHAFIVVAAEDTLFDATQKLLADGAGVDLLTGVGGTDKFDDVSGVYDLLYFKSGLSFDADDQQAPMSGVPAVIELQIPAGITMDALQIGETFQGTWFEDLYYSEIQSPVARQRIYEYFAMRHHLWSKNSDGLFVYPFAANRARSLETDIENYLSTPYSGPQKALVRGSFESGLDLPFALREQAEYEAAEAFFEQHRPITPFVFKDYRFIPPRETAVQFSSSIRDQGSEVTYRFNYAFSVVETDVPEPPDTTPPCAPIMISTEAIDETTVRLTFYEPDDDCEGVPEMTDDDYLLFS